MAVKFPKIVTLILISTLTFLPLSSHSKTYTKLNQGSSSLSSPGDVLVSSPARIFTAGFYAVGENAYCFSIWYTHAPDAGGPPTIVWMANRDRPVNGRGTKLSLLPSGSLVLRDAGLVPVWSTGTAATDSAAAVLQLHDNGDLVLQDEATAVVMWRSFGSPTDTLLPQQALARSAKLVSSRSPTNHSSGSYELYFDDDNVLRLLYAGVDGGITSVFWPAPWSNSWEAGRTTYNNSKTAALDPYGRFSSSDDLRFATTDAGIGTLRRMKLDVDGLIRVYSFHSRRGRGAWEVSWQMQMPPCNVHGICGANSLCTYSSAGLGRRCACLPFHKPKNSSDWSQGCVPDYHQVKCDNISDGFVRVNHAEFYGYDIGFYQNLTLKDCERLCLSYCDCRGFQYKFDWGSGFYNCFPKTLLFNGYQSSGFEYWMYLRLPKHKMQPLSEIQIKPIPLQLQCMNSVVEIERSYTRKKRYTWLRSLAWCVGVLGGVEFVCVLIFLYKTRENGSKLREQGFFQVATGFTRFTYAELKKASRNFSEEIGRGGSGVVYKGVLPDNRVAAIKRLNEANQGEEEFLVEVSLLGRLNHANLIERWGYCAEGKHRLLVYEYLGNGSLAENLSSNKLEPRKKFEIALGTAKGLAYLHEECLEWVLHCDVKPHNILLDENYQPKVADFGLSKQVKRSGVENLNVSMIRGTRGYMAPEWVYNQPITAKVDVYSYGIVVLEMVTGKSPKEIEEGRSSWHSDWIDEIVKLGEIDDDVDGMKSLVRAAFQCAQENRDARPTMTQVVDMLLGH